MNKAYKKSDHYDGKKFFNPGITADKSFSDLIKWNMNRPKSNWPIWIENKFTGKPVEQCQQNEVVITYVNHSTFLIQSEKHNILTDPIWSERTSPVSFAGPKRIHKPGLEFDQLPKIDFVLVSHNHYDHMDLPTLKMLYKKFNPTFIVPLANAQYLEDFGNDIKIVELDWWESHQTENLKIYLTPVQHWSARGLFDRRDALWGGYVIEENKKKIFFGGDTGYSDWMFKKIFETYGAMDLALLPIGSYEPRWFMKQMHFHPEDAILAHLDLHSKKSIGMHFGTFKLTDENIEQPVIDLNAAKIKFKIDNFEVLSVGETKKFSY